MANDAITGASIGVPLVLGGGDAAAQGMEFTPAQALGCPAHPHAGCPLLRARGVQPPGWGGGGVARCPRRRRRAGR